MPAFSNIVIADGKATPVNHTFEPIQRAGNSAHWAEVTGNGSLIQRNLMTFELKQPVNGNRKTVASKVEISLPLLLSSVALGAPADVYGLPTIVKVEVISDPRAPSLVLDDAVAFAKNVVANALIAEGMKKRTNFSG